MATYRLWSGASGAANGSSWADAYLTLTAALAAATAAGDIILVHKTHTEALAVSTVYTALNHIAIICVDKDNGDALAQLDGTTGYLKNTNKFDFTGAYRVYCKGLWVESSNAATGFWIAIGTADGSQYELEDCVLRLAGTGGAGQFSFGYDAAARNAAVRLKNCELRFHQALQGMSIYGNMYWDGGALTTSSAMPTTLIKATSNGVNAVEWSGVDLSAFAGTLMYDATQKAQSVVLSGCSLNASMTPLATQTIGNLGSAQVYYYDCAAGDIHYALAHYSAMGSTEVSSAIYANDNPTYDGTIKCSWKITTTANVSQWSPYVSPWIDKLPASVGAAVTPSFEVLRDGSATAFNDDEVWAEFAYKGMSGSVKLTFANDRKVPLASAAAQATSSKGAGDWTGENATAWFGTLGLGAAITPQEAGYMRGRVCVGVPSSTLYVDPNIRGI